MAKTDGVGSSDVLLNYAGPLFTITPQGAPLLTMTGGLTGGQSVSTDTFPMSNDITLDDASSTTVTETASLTIPDSDIYIPTQNINYIEVKQRAFTLSYKKLASNAQISGEAVINMGQNTITGLQSQRDAHLAQMARDMEWSMFRGVGTDPTTAGTNGKTTGIITAVNDDGNTEVDATTAGLTSAHMNSLERAILAKTNDIQNPIIFCGSWQKQQLDEIYGFAPASTTAGGVRLNTINLPIIGEVGVIYSAVVPAATLVLVDVAKVAPVFQIIPGKPAVFFEERPFAGAGVSEALYSHFGVNYQRADSHGTIINLATS